MSPLWRRPRDVDELLANSKELRAQLQRTIERLDRFVDAFNNEAEHEQAQEPGESQ
jgi:uncharacterized protein YeaO (DUF488 family)